MTSVADSEFDSVALRRWERHAEIPLMIGAFIFLIVYAVPILWPQLPEHSLRWCRWLAWLSLAMFVIDYVVRAALASDRRRYLIRHWADLLVIVLPLLRPLRLLRLLALLNVLNRRVAARLRGWIAVYVAGGSVLLAFCAALAELDAERNAPDANIVTFGDAMWWAATTMTTVGYGDTYPVTGRGRLIAVALMIGGIALLGTVTATLASWLVEAVQNERRDAVDLRAELDALHAKLDQALGGRDRAPSVRRTSPCRGLDELAAHASAPQPATQPRATRFRPGQLVRNGRAAVTLCPLDLLGANA